MPHLELPFHMSIVHSLSVLHYTSFGIERRKARASISDVFYREHGRLGREFEECLKLFDARNLEIAT